MFETQLVPLHRLQHNKKLNSNPEKQSVPRACQQVHGYTQTCVISASWSSLLHLQPCDVGFKSYLFFLGTAQFEASGLSTRSSLREMRCAAATSHQQPVGEIISLARYVTAFLCGGKHHKKKLYVESTR